MKVISLCVRTVFSLVQADEDFHTIALQRICGPAEDQQLFNQLLLLYQTADICLWRIIESVNKQLRLFFICWDKSWRTLMSQMSSAALVSMKLLNVKENIRMTSHDRILFNLQPQFFYMSLFVYILMTTVCLQRPKTNIQQIKSNQTELHLDFNDFFKKKQILLTCHPAPRQRQTPTSTTALQTTIKDTHTHTHTHTVNIIQENPTRPCDFFLFVSVEQVHRLWVTRLNSWSVISEAHRLQFTMATAYKKMEPPFHPVNAETWKHVNADCALSKAEPETCH